MVNRYRYRQNSVDLNRGHITMNSFRARKMYSDVFVQFRNR